MIGIDTTRVRFVQSANDLPNIAGVWAVHLDTETTSFTPKRGGTRPHQGDRACGIGFTVDDCPYGWYIPIRHKPNAGLFSAGLANFPIELAMRFVQDLLTGRSWRNHNIKFDAHILAADGVDPLAAAEWIDTLSAAKVVDMQSRQDGYGQKELVERWLGRPPTERQAVKAFLAQSAARVRGHAVKASEDYGDCDAMVLGGYAVDDCLENRELLAEIERRRYPGDEKIWELEKRVARALYKVERNGVRIDVDGMRRAKREAETTIAKMEDEAKRLGHRVNLSSDDAVRHYVIDDLKLPVVAWTAPESEGSEPNPSVGADAITEYLALPQVLADQNLKRFFEVLEIHREENQFVDMYAKGWLDRLGLDGRMHPEYNAIVRTGRMSCKNPNWQNLNPRAKQFVLPDPGLVFCRRDYSQIEYRFIVDICGEMDAIAAYQQDPDTDFHVYVAGICGIDRQPAKSVNFGISFGMGDKTLIRTLSRTVGGGEAAQARAQGILTTWHRRFYRVRPTSKACERKAALRGYIQTLYGRRRAIPIDWARIAFNTAVQGSAADLFKETFCLLSEDTELERKHGMQVKAVVHDENLLQLPPESAADPKVHQHIDHILTQRYTIEMRVPIRVGAGMSALNWADTDRKKPKPAAPAGPVVPFVPAIDPARPLDDIPF